MNLEGIIVHTETQEQWNKVNEIAVQYGWNGIPRATWEEGLCYWFGKTRLGSKKSEYSGRKYAIDNNESILSYSDFIKYVEPHKSIESAVAETKPTNPKDAIGSDKLPLHLFPTTAIAQGSLALLDGALKYGRTNYRAIGVRASIYHDACLRHMTKWFEGEEVDEDSGVDHLAHAIACIAILIDAKAAGKLNDDRMIEGGYLKMLKELTPKVAELKKKHESKSAKHYDIGDNTL